MTATTTHQGNNKRTKGQSKMKGKLKGTGTKISVYWWRWASDITRSIAPDLKGCPHDNLDPLMACMDERRREKVSRQRSQHRVLLYVWSHFEDSMEASLL